MVWHAHLLNPWDFLEDCIRYDNTRLWNTGLPLSIIDACINNMTFQYLPGENARECFERTTGFDWDNIKDVKQHTLSCPKCAEPNEVQWTTLTTADWWREPIYRDRGFGFADPDFVMTCSRCSTSSTHETLRVQKFRNDREALLEMNLPMPGTILNIKGESTQCHHPNRK